MHATGHVGIGFATAVPVAVGLDHVGLGPLVVPATILLVGLSTLPDVDEHLPRVSHRGVTHSLPFALAVGLLTGGLGWVFGPAFGALRPDAAAVGLAVGVLAVGSHVLADAVTPMGVYPAWPISRQRRSLDAVRSANVGVNRLLLAVGLTGWLLTVTLVTGL